MAKLRLLASVVAMVAMLMAALPATAFADDDEVPVTCGVFLVAIAPGQDEVDGNEVKNKGGAAMGTLTCDVPSLSGGLTLSNIKSKVTLGGSPSFVSTLPEAEVAGIDAGEALILFGITLGGPFIFDTFSGKLKADIAVGSLTGKIKVQVSGKILVDMTGAPVLTPEGNIIGFAEVYSDGKWKVEGDSLEAEGDFVEIFLALTVVGDDITLLGGGMISGELESDDDSGDSEHDDDDDDEDDEDDD